MAHIIQGDEPRALSLSDYMNYIKNNLDEKSSESMLEHAWALRALANDRDFVLDAIHKHANDIADGEWKSGIGGASIILAEEEKFYLRANIWMPSPINRLAENLNFYSYDLPHDHNFTFLTVGYMGSGYKTKLYKYDYNSVLGIEGEESGAEYCGVAQLSPGTMMLYEAGKDIHIQFPPESPSISLNLIIRPVLGQETQQYIFSRDAKIIVAGSSDTVTNRLALLDFFRDHNDRQTIAEVTRIALENRCLRTQACALSVLRDLDGDIAAKIESLLAVEVVRRSWVQPVRTEARMS